MDNKRDRGWLKEVMEDAERHTVAMSIFRRLSKEQREEFIQQYGRKTDGRQEA